MNDGSIEHPGKVLADFARHGNSFGKRSGKGNTVPEQLAFLALDKNHLASLYEFDKAILRKNKNDLYKKNSYEFNKIWKLIDLKGEKEKMLGI